jgi:preprotein translocase subunit SecG
MIQVVLAVLLIVSIISQNKGAGLSNVFGGGGAIYRTKRGLEKWLFYSTIVLAIAFVSLSIATVLTSKI